MEPALTTTPGHHQIITDLWPHPLTAEGRTTRVARIASGAALSDLVFGAVADLGVDSTNCECQAVVSLNGRRVPSSEWGATRVDSGACIVMRRTVTGGGGDSNPLKVILTLAVIAAAIFAPYALGLTSSIVTAAGTVTTVTALGQVVGAGVLLAGTLILNALVPPRIPGVQNSSAGAQADPIFSISAGTNRARLYEPLLLVLGRHRVHPDLGAAPHTEFAADEQYLHQIFNFGLGLLDVSELKIGQTPLADFEEATSEWSDTRGRISLVAGNVDTITGAALTSATEWTMRRTGADTRRIGIDITGTIFRVDGRGEIQPHTVALDIEYRRAGTDDAYTHHHVRLTHDASTAHRVTRSYDVPSGEWEVRVRRAEPPDESDRVYDAVTWSALRSYQPDPASYIGQTRLGLRIRASGQLSGRIERLSAIVQQMVPIWDPGVGEWTEPVATSNPAWIFRWYCAGVRIEGRLVAGVGLPETRIDDASIKAWGAWCDTQGLGCDLVLDKTQSHHDVLTTIAQCGRASPSWSTGRLGVVWDEGGRPVTALFSPANIVAGTLDIQYATGPVADEIVCRYIEPDLDWQLSSVRRTVPGVARASSSVTLTLTGVTRRDAAAAECNLHAARQVYHRRTITWETGPEGFAVARGDVVYLTHSLLDGGVAGRLVGGDTTRLSLSRPIRRSGDDDHLVLRLPDGSLHTSRLAPAVPGRDETTVIELITPLEARPDADGASPLDTLWRFYDSDTPPDRVRIIGLEPTADRRVRIQAIDEVDRYYTAASSDLSVPLPPLRRHPPTVAGLAIHETLIRAGRGGYLVQFEVSLTVSGDWRGGIIRAALDGGAARTVARLIDGETTATWIGHPRGTMTVSAIPGTEVAPSGASYSVEHQIVGLLVPPGAPTNFLVDVLGDRTRRFRWDSPNDVDVIGFVVRFAPRGADGTSTAWPDMTPLHDGVLVSSPYEVTAPDAGAWIFGIAALDAAGLTSEPIYIIADLPPPRIGDAIYWGCPSAQGWPGVIADGAERSDDTQDSLDGIVDYRWADLESWHDWMSWGAGTGSEIDTRIDYRPPPIDLGFSTTWAARWTADVVGNAEVSIAAAETRGALEAAPYVPLAATSYRGRWLAVQFDISGTATHAARLDHLCVSVHAPAVVQRHLDVDTSTLAGAAATGRTIPTTIGHVTDVSVVLQSVGPHWSWSLDHKNNPTLIRIFDGSGAPADATIDITVRGITI